MKYICLGYMEEKKWETMSESERNALMDECFAYDELRKNGNFAGGEGLQSARNSTTLRWKTGKVSITDGPYAETKEHLGGIGVLEARGPGRYTHEKRTGNLALCSEIGHVGYDRRSQGEFCLFYLRKHLA
jgi:hypothetical protein